jgi:DNA repair protein RadC
MPVVLLLNTRRKIKGHQIISLGTHDTILVHPMNVFRLAVVTSAAAIVLMHNHPSGDVRIALSGSIIQAVGLTRK